MPDPLPPEIGAFFDRYRDAFNRLDGEAVARCFALPSGILMGGSYVHWPDLEVVRDNMLRLCAQYRSHGYRQARYEIAWGTMLGPDACIVALAWQIDRHGELEPWRFHTAYNLARSPEGWRILLCTAYEEPLRASNLRPAGS